MPLPIKFVETLEEWDTFFLCDNCQHKTYYDKYSMVVARIREDLRKERNGRINLILSSATSVLLKHEANPPNKISEW